MFWYFLITLRNNITGETKTLDICKHNGFGAVNYFDAYKQVIDSAKEKIDSQDDPFSWIIESIEDVTRY